MKQMIYKAGGDTSVWGIKAQTKIIDSHDLAEHLEDGWVDHPSKLFDLVPASHEAREHAVVTVDGNVDPIVDKGEISDGYHTFNELYAHRVRLFSTLMRAFSRNAWWSFCHSDGEEWDGWILAGIDTPAGAVTYHLPESEIPHLPEGTEIEFGKEWDGHTANDVLDRLISLALPEPEPEPEPEQKTSKRGRKPKGTADEFV